jgi:hypothetical protein
LPEPPRKGACIAATRTPDHRRLYLDHEGPVSGNRGVVKCRARGAFTWIHRGENAVTVRLEGDRLNGVLSLLREEGETWRVCYEPGQG